MNKSITSQFHLSNLAVKHLLQLRHILVQTFLRPPDYDYVHIPRRICIRNPAKKTLSVARNIDKLRNPFVHCNREESDGIRWIRAVQFQSVRINYLCSFSNRIRYFSVFRWCSVPRNFCRIFDKKWCSDNLVRAIVYETWTKVFSTQMKSAFVKKLKVIKKHFTLKIDFVYCGG